MSRSTDTHNVAADYPTFLDPNAETSDTENFEEFQDDDGAGHYEDAGVDEGDGENEENYDENDYEDDLVDEDSDLFEAPNPPAFRSKRRRYQTAKPPASGGLLMVLGLLAAIAGVATTFQPAAAAAIAKFVEPQILVILGFSLVAIAAVMRRTSQLQQRLEQMDDRRSDFDEELRDTLANLAQPHTPVNGEAADVQHVMLSLQRQDQKINNLTKAIKMYGKPLMEIAGQGTELAGGIGQVKTLIEGAAESTRQAVNRVEQQVRSSNNSMEFNAIPGQLNKLEAALDSITQQFADTTQNLNKGIEQLREGSLGDLEDSMRKVQRELGSLATGMSQVQASVQSNGYKAAKAASPAATQAAPATAQPAAAQQATDTQPTTEANDRPADDYATGQRKVASKNVLGAIAKLKQMKR